MANSTSKDSARPERSAGRKDRIGFAGIGRMGAPMASHIARAGWPLAVFDIRPDLVERFSSDHPGVHKAVDLADLARTSDIVLVMVPSSREVEAVVLGDGGLAEHLSPGALVIDCSTSDPLVTRRIGEALEARGIQMMDAPVAGGVPYVAEGNLDVMAGGPDSAMERAAPVLDAFAGTLHHCGPLASGHALKALVNFVNAQILITYGEALTAGIKFGIDPGVLREAMEAGTGGRNHQLPKKVVRHVMTRKFQIGMALELSLKDVTLARDLIRSLGLSAPVASNCRDLWARAVEEIGAGSDMTESLRMWEREAGVEITGGAGLEERLKQP